MAGSTASTWPVDLGRVTRPRLRQSGVDRLRLESEDREDDLVHPPDRLTSREAVEPSASPTQPRRAQPNRVRAFGPGGSGRPDSLTASTTERGPGVVIHSRFLAIRGSRAAVLAGRARHGTRVVRGLLGRCPRGAGGSRPPRSGRSSRHPTRTRSPGCWRPLARTPRPRAALAAGSIRR